MLFALDVFLASPQMLTFVQILPELNNIQSEELKIRDAFSLFFGKRDANIHVTYGKVNWQFPCFVTLAVLLFTLLLKF